MLYTSSHSIGRLAGEAGVITLTLHIRKLGLREAKEIAQNHTASKWESPGLTSSQTPKPYSSYYTLLLTKDHENSVRKQGLEPRSRHPV